MRGFSRETLVELTTNIESQEHRRRMNSMLGYSEHPRAGVTDDLETLFAIFHRYLGPVFTLKQFKEMWPKIVRYFFCKTKPSIHYPSCPTREEGGIVLRVQKLTIYIEIGVDVYNSISYIFVPEEGAL